MLKVYQTFLDYQLSYCFLDNAFCRMYTFSHLGEFAVLLPGLVLSFQSINAILLISRFIYLFFKDFKCEVVSVFPLS